MTVCSYYQRGTCKFGDRCKYEHPGSQRDGSSTFGGGNRSGFNAFGGGDRYRPSGGSGGAFGGNRTGTPGYSLTKEEIKTDLTTQAPEYIFSCYGPGRDAPRQLMEGPVEISEEEFRYRVYSQKAVGNEAATKQEFLQIYNNRQQQVKQILGDLDGAIKYVEDGENTHPNRQDIAKSKVIPSNTTNTAPTPTPNAFANAATNPFGGNQAQNSAPANPFGGANQTQPSAFAKPANPFGQPSTLGQTTSAFGQTSALGGASPFGKPSPLGGGSAFGQASALGGAFGKPSPLGGGSAFGQTSALGQQSTFGKASAPGATPAFGQATAPGARPAFGQTTAPGLSSTFGQVSAPGTTSAFGQTSQPGTASAFGKTSQPGATSAFGQTSQPGQTSAFGVASKPGQTSAFGQATPFGQANPLGQANTFNKPAFGQSTFGQAGQAKPNPFAAAAAQNKTTTAPAFGAATQPQAPNAFAQAAAQQAPAPSAFGGQQAPTAQPTQPMATPISATPGGAVPVAVPEEVYREGRPGDYEGEKGQKLMQIYQRVAQVGVFDPNEDIPLVPPKTEWVVAVPLPSAQVK